MRLLRFLVSYAIVTVLSVILLLFVALNHYTVSLDVFGPEYSVSVALVMGGAVAFGFVIALLLVLPDRIASAINGRRLEREVHYLEQDLIQLQELRARLLARHDYLVEGHERVLLRYHSLLNDHSRVVAERDDAREELATVRAARPIAAAAGHSSSAPLRLLSPAAAPAPAARAAAQPPAARVSAQVAADEPRVERREAWPEPQRAMSAALLPVPIGVSSSPPRQVPVTSITEVTPPPPAVPVAPSAQAAAPEPPIAQPTPPQRHVEPQKPRVQPGVLLQRARHGVATQRDRAQRGLAAQRDGIQHRITVLSGQVRPHVEAFRATVETQLEQIKQRLTTVSGENVTGDEEQDQAGAPRVASASHPLGE
jgi:uncharacterized integral membrane protein